MRHSQANSVAGRGAGPERVVPRRQDRQVPERAALPGDDRTGRSPSTARRSDAHAPPWPASSLVKCPMHLNGPPLTEAISLRRGPGEDTSGPCRTAVRYRCCPDAGHIRAGRGVAGVRGYPRRWRLGRLGRWAGAGGHAAGLVDGGLSEQLDAEAGVASFMAVAAAPLPAPRRRRPR